MSTLPIETISKHASEVRPGPVLLTVITAFFFAIGWVAGASWRGAVFCCLAVRYGYRTGAHVPVEAAHQAGG